MSQLLKFEVLVNKEGHGSQILIKFKYILIDTLGFPGGASGKESTCQCRRHKRCEFNPRIMKIPWKRKWQPTLVFLPGKSHGQRSLEGYSPWGSQRADMYTLYIYIYPLIKVWEFWFIGRKCWDSQWWSHFCFILTFRFVYCPIPLFLFQPTFSTSPVFYFRNTFLGLPWWSSGWDFAFWCTGCRFNLWPGVKIPHATQPKIQNIKWEQYCKKFNKDFKNGLHQKKKLYKKRNTFLNAFRNYFHSATTLKFNYFHSAQSNCHFSVPPLWLISNILQSNALPLSLLAIFWTPFIFETLSLLVLRIHIFQFFYLFPCLVAPSHSLLMCYIISQYSNALAVRPFISFLFHLHLSFYWYHPIVLFWIAFYSIDIYVYMSTVLSWTLDS